jgi:site-specific DNA-methyltransferase (adenine-specific)
MMPRGLGPVVKSGAAHSPKVPERSTIEIKVEKLKVHPLISEIFEDLTDRDYEALKKDIAENGIKYALHVLPDCTVLCGHQRLRAAKELGLETAPCEVKEFKTDSEMCVWAIKDNLVRRQLTTEQRYLLYAKLSELYEVGRGGIAERDAHGKILKPKDATVTSSGDVLEKTAKEMEESPATIARARAYKLAVEEMPELRTTTVTSAIYEYKRRKNIEERKEVLKGAPVLKNLLLGNALEKVDEISDNSVDALITDPPYGTGTETARTEVMKVRGELWKASKWNTEDIFPLLDKLLERAKMKLKDDAHIYIFTSWKVWHRLYPIVSKHFEVKNCIIWNKGTAYLGERLGYNFMDHHELILFATTGKRKLNYTGEKPGNIISGVKSPYNIKRLHPTEKPVELCKRLISYSTVEGETVLDPFAGSGSTLVAAEELGRNWIGIEIDPQWYDVAKMRITELRKPKEVSENA